MEVSAMIKAAFQVAGVFAMELSILAALLFL